MKLKKEFVTHTADGETLLLSTSGTGFSGVVKGNRTFAAILDLLKEETTEEEIVAGMQRLYEGDREAIASDVRKALTQLREIGALE